MSDALATYLNDHLAGATLGCEHARHLEQQSAGTPLGDTMAALTPEIEADREELLGIIDRLGVERSTVKQATTWIAEKLARPKFNGTTSGDAALGRFLALETLSLGVEGKLALWRTLGSVADGGRELDPELLERLAERARSQREILERERGAAAQEALT